MSAPINSSGSFAAIRVWSHARISMCGIQALGRRREVDLIVADVSFISLTLVLPPAFEALKTVVTPSCSSNRNSS